MKNLVVLFIGMLVAVFAQAQSPCGALFEEQNGLVVVEIESVEPTGSWTSNTSIDGYTGDAYYVWTGGNNFGNPGEGVMEYTIRINQTGTYRFQWRSRITQGNESSEHNDSWLRFPDAADFYGRKGDHIVYPKGTGKTPNPNGASADGWFKIYMSTLNNWSWQARTSDHDAHDIYVEFDSPGVYKMQVSGRSQGHGIDRAVLYHSSVSGNNARDLNNEQTICTDGGNGNTGNDGNTGDGTFTIDGELKKWHKVSITFDGPQASETGNPNPFTDYRMDVTFTKGNKSYKVPGYFAADGNAASSSATSGNKWRVHFAPDETGEWSFTTSFRKGNNVALSNNSNAGSAFAFDGTSGTFTIGQTDKAGRDLRGKGRLQYVNEHYLQFAETGEYFLKIGADAPENFLAYDGFDNTPDYGGRRKDWGPHVQDWNNGDPTWKNGKGKGIIGAVNYLAETGQNVFSFLTMNIAGDDRNVFPYVSDGAGDRLKIDVSKVDQWEIVLEHADKMGMYLHFKTQETENDQLLDDGALGNQRKLYYRELIARFGHHLALNWNIGEENTNTNQQRIDFAQYFYDNDPYRHNVVIHTFPGQHQQVYEKLVGNQSTYTGVSVQTSWNSVHQRTLQWVTESAETGRKWVVANDEQGNANIGVPHDGYNGGPDQDEVRKATLWGNLMAGGAGVEYYFGYQLPHSDLTCEDFRSRSNMWTYNKIAHDFFTEFLPFWEMTNRNDLIGNNNNSNNKYCLANPGSIYAVYLAEGGSTNINLGDNNQNFTIKWYNPRNGGSLQNGTVTNVDGPGNVDLGDPPNSPNQDWVILVTSEPIACDPAGTPCDDGNPTTTNDVEDGECGCAGTPCPLEGTACDDGNPNTTNDIEDGSCNCVGCLVEGTSCDDGDPSTFDDVEDGNCNCAGTPCPVAGTSCDDGNPDTINDIEDGFCNCIGVDPNAATDIWLEAECAVVGSGWTVNEDNAASYGQYATPPQETSLNDPPTGAENMISFSFSVSEAGTYKIFARTMTTEDGDDSFWVRANGGAWQKWNKINAENYAPIYQWDQVGNWPGGDLPEPVTFELNAGINIVEFGRREPNVRLDKIFVTRTQGQPEVIGAPGTNCSITNVNEPLPEILEEVNVFPNPTQDLLIVNYSLKPGINWNQAQAQIKVIDLLGRTLLVQPMDQQRTGNITLDLSNFASGLYMLTIDVDGVIYTHPFEKI